MSFMLQTEFSEYYLAVRNCYASFVLVIVFRTANHDQRENDCNIITRIAFDWLPT